MDPNIRGSQGNQKPPVGQDPNDTLLTKEEVEKEGKTSSGLKKVSNLNTDQSTKVDRSEKIISTIKKTPRPLPIVPLDTPKTKVSNEEKEKPKAIEQPAKITNYISEETLQVNEGMDDTPPDIAENKKQLELAMHRQDKISQKLKGLRSDYQVLKDKFPPDVLKEMPQQDRLEIQKQLKEAKQKVWEAKKEFDEGFMEVAAIRSGMYRLHPEIEGRSRPIPAVLKAPEKPKPVLVNDDDGIFPLTPEDQLIKSKKDRKVLHFKLLEIENKLNDLHQEHSYANDLDKTEIQENIDRLKEKKLEISTEINRLDDLITILFSATKNSLEAEHTYLQEDVELCEINLQTALATGDPDKIRAAQSKLDDAKLALTNYESKMTAQLNKLDADQQFIKKTGKEFKPILELDNTNKFSFETSSSSEGYTKTGETGSDQTKFEINTSAEPVVTTSEFKTDSPPLNEQNQPVGENKDERILEDTDLPLEEDVTVPQDVALEESNSSTSESPPLETYSATHSTSQGANIGSTPAAEVGVNQEQVEAENKNVNSKAEDNLPLKGSSEVHLHNEPRLTKEHILFREAKLNEGKAALKLALDETRVIQEDFQLTLDDYVLDLKLISQEIDQLPKELKLAILENREPIELQKHPPEIQALVEGVLKKLQGLVRLSETLKSKEIEKEHHIAHIEMRARVLQQEWNFFEQKLDQIRELYPGNVIRKPPQLKEVVALKKDSSLTLEQMISKFSELVIIQNAIERAQTEGGQYVVALNLAGQMAQYHSRGVPLVEASRVKEQQKNETETAQRGSESGKGGSEGGTKDESSGHEKSSDSQDEEQKKGRANSQDDDENGPNMSGRNVRIVKVT